MLTPSCYPCMCRKCDYLPSCDVGDMAPLHPCEACGGKTYLTEGCTLQATKDDLRLDPQTVVQAYNDICVDMPKVQKLTPSRRKAIRARKAMLQEFEQVFSIAQASEFLSGRNGAWPGCNFDWLLCPSNWQRVLEGTYSREPLRPPPKVAESMDYPQKRYTEQDLSHIFVALD